MILNMNMYEKKQLINRIQTEIAGFNKDELIDYYLYKIELSNENITYNITICKQNNIEFIHLLRQYESK